MNVVIMHQHFRLPTQAGSTRIYSFAKGLSNRNHKVIVITGSGCRGNLIAAQSKYRREWSLYAKFSLPEDIKVISINDFYNQKLSFVGRLLSFLLFALISCWVVLKLQRIHVIFASSTPLSIAIPAILSHKIRKIPFVFEVRDLWPEAPIQLGLLKNKAIISLAHLLEASAYGNASTIIGTSEGIRRKIEAKSGKTVAFIPHGVDEEFFDEHDENGSVKNERKLKVIYAGACGFNNAIEVFLQVARLFAAENDLRKVDFVLVGDGPALEQLRKGNWINVRFLGQLPKTDVIRALKSADIALFSQRKAVGGSFKKDSLPNKFFDFLGASLPIVGGIERGGEMERYINNYKCGIAVDSEDVQGLYNGVKRLLIDSDLRKRMSMAAGELGRKFSKDIQVEKFVRIIENYAE
jgi:glycosyltransferase involved in cell wall biosynthesis